MPIDYGLDVWIWYPALDDDYSRPEMVEFALNEWEQVYQALPRIDAILVPGGDPGNTRPRDLLPMIEKQTALLHRYHPQAQMWISAQGFNDEWMDEFLDILRDESPDWLTGVVYGPWIHMTIARIPRPGAGALSYPQLSRHHPQPGLPVPGSGLGYCFCPDRRPRDDQPAPAQRGGHLPPDGR